jgi:hypothetical protein
MNGGGNGRAGSAAIGGGVVTGAPSDDDDGVIVAVGGSASPGGCAGGAGVGLFVLSLRLPNSMHACGRNHVGINIDVFRRADKHPERPYRGCGS